MGVLIYRLVSHPLNKYPGPLMARLTGLPVLYHAWNGDLHYYLYRLHCAYGKQRTEGKNQENSDRIKGENVRYSPNKLSINNVKALGGKIFDS